MVYCIEFKSIMKKVRKKVFENPAMKDTFLPLDFNTLLDHLSKKT